MDITAYFSCVLLSSNPPSLVDRSLKRRQVKPLAASLLDALDYDSSDDSDFEVGDASGEHSLFKCLAALNLYNCTFQLNNENKDS